MRPRFLNWWKSSRKQSTPVQRRLAVETLESRDLPSYAILFIGNSYTAYNDTRATIDDLVHDIAVAAGEPAPAVVRSVYYGGTLEQQAARFSPTILRGLLPAGYSNWDYVVIQPNALEDSAAGGLHYYGSADYMQTGAIALTAEIHAASPNAKIIMYEPWARRTDNPNPSDIYTDVFTDPAQMTAAIQANDVKVQNALIKAFPGLDVAIAPAGSAWQVVDNFDALSIDGVTHPDPEGALLTAQTIFDTIYDRTTSSIPLAAVESLLSWRDLTAGQWSAMGTAADFAVGSLDQGPNTAFLSRLYRDLLGRSIDAAGLANWLPALTSGTLTRAQVADQVLHSQEYETDEIEAAYKQYLGRAADPSGLANYISQIQNGATIESIDSIIFASPEAVAYRKGSLTVSLQDLYQTWLNRTAGSSDISYWTNQIDSGEITLAGAAYAIIDSAEANTVQIEDQFESYLGRPVDAGTLTTWQANLAGGMDYADLTLSIVSSLEFRNLD